MAQQASNNELDIETKFDDEIHDAIYDAFSNADGHCSSKYLRYELAKRGLRIVSTQSILLETLKKSALLETLKKANAIINSAINGGHHS